MPFLANPQIPAIVAEPAQSRHNLHAKKNAIVNSYYVFMVRIKRMSYKLIKISTHFNHLTKQHKLSIYAK